MDELKGLEQFELDFKNINEVERYCRYFINNAGEALKLKNLLAVYFQVDYEIERMENVAQVKIDTKYNTCAILIHAAMFSNIKQLNSAIMHELVHCMSIQIKRYQQAHGQEQPGMTVLFDHAYEMLAIRIVSVLETEGIVDKIAIKAIKEFENESAELIGNNDLVLNLENVEDLFKVDDEA